MRVWGRTLSLHFTIICRTLHTAGGDECVGVEEEELGEEEDEIFDCSPSVGSAGGPKI